MAMTLSGNDTDWQSSGNDTDWRSPAGMTLTGNDTQCPVTLGGW